MVVCHFLCCIIRNPELSENRGDLIFEKEHSLGMEQWKGEEEMGPVFAEITAPGLREAEMKGREKGREEGREEGRMEGILGTVDILQGSGPGRAKIAAAARKQYGLTDSGLERCLENRGR